MRPLVLLLAALALPAAAAGAPKAPAAPRPGNPDALQGLSGLPIPRFVSIGTTEANMRTGPGKQYPVAWTYRRKGLPVEVVREWGIWRMVRDPDGTTGWIDKGLISGDRTLLVTRAVRDLYARPDLQSPVVWRAEPGVVLSVRMCADQWCRVSADGKSGFILRAHTWGSYAGEAIGD